MHERYQRVRQFTAKICEPLSTEDCVVQSMPDVSPTRWHLAHTTWFFETFVVLPNVIGSRPFDDAYGYLFNSYYNTIGKQFPRAERGLLTRPSVAEVWQYRMHVDAEVAKLLASEPSEAVLQLIELGLQHEQQHQELMLTDVKHVLSRNPLHPVYRAGVGVAAAVRDQEAHDPHRGPATVDQKSVHYPRQTTWIGHDSPTFCYDNELPRHEHLLHSYRLAERLVTNCEYLEFMQDGGYENPAHWLSMGWGQVQQQRWTAPMYWIQQDDRWFHFTLGGLVPVDPHQPVCHVSYFEADAFARWQGRRLPTEFEWEHAAANSTISGNFVDNQNYHPVALTDRDADVSQLWGDVWEWTSSAYAAYPKYRANDGALGEYNGKFMCNQFVLRGGSCATTSDHMRPSYRNFFPPDARWQFTGIRTADDGQ